MRAKSIFITGLLVFIITGFVLCQDKERVMALLYEEDISRTKYNEDIVFIEKINMGIPGGDNWLVEWYGNGNGRLIMVYVIDKDYMEIREDFFILSSSSGPLYFTSYNVYQDLPGTTIDQGMCQVGDFNNDGLDEILIFAYGASYPTLQISGYDSKTNSYKWYCSFPFSLVDVENGPSPVKFTTYKGIKGFKVYDLLSSGLPWWYFCAWNAESREFEKIGEYLPEEGSERSVAEDDTITPDNLMPARATGDKTSNETPNTPDPEPVMTDAVKPFPLTFVIIGIGAAVVIIILALALRRKKP
jgi:hypothetical protein